MAKLVQKKIDFKPDGPRLEDITDSPVAPRLKDFYEQTGARPPLG